MINNVVNVKLWGRIVGQVYWSKERRKALFSYSADWIKTGLEIAPLTAPVKSPRAIAGLPFEGEAGKLYEGLPPFLADSLPDDWGNRLFRQWAINNKIPWKDITPVDRLAYMGSRGMGALEFEPALNQDEISGNIHLDLLYKAAQNVLSERFEISVQSKDVSLQLLCQVGTSPGGRRPKALVAINDETGEIRSGQVANPPGFSYYILKFDEAIPLLSPAIEYTYWKMADDAGIDMMQSGLVEIEGRKHFLTKRFDRQDGKKIHRLSLAGITPLADSYEDLFQVARLLRLQKKEIQELFRRTVFNILACNVDDHNKNFSFLMGEDGKWRLAPAYDLTFTVDPSAPGYVNRHCLSLGGKDAGFVMKDILYFAKNNDIADADMEIRRVADAVAKFSRFAKEADVDTSVIHLVEKSIKEASL